MNKLLYRVSLVFFLLGCVQLAAGVRYTFTLGNYAFHRPSVREY